MVCSLTLLMNIEMLDQFLIIILIMNAVVESNKPSSIIEIVNS